MFFRDIAQRVLCERNTESTRDKLGKLIIDESAPRKARLHALWSLIGTGSLDTNLHLQLLADKDATFRAWGVRAAGNYGKDDAKVRDKVADLVADASRDVQLQVVIAARKIDGIEPMPRFAKVLATCGDDKILPAIVWQNLHPLLEGKGEPLVKLLEKADLKASPNLAALLPRAADRVLGSKDPDVSAVCALVVRLADRERGHADSCCQCLEALAAKIETGEISGDRRRMVADKVGPVIRQHLTGDAKQRMVREAILLAAALRDEEGLARAHRFFFEREGDDAARARALNALISAADKVEARQRLLTDLEPVLDSAAKESSVFRGQVLAALARLDHPPVAEVVLHRYPKMEPELQPKAIELLTQRAAWSKALLKQVEQKKIPAGAINVNQVKKMLALKDADLSKHVTAVWGILREDRNPQREKIVTDMRTLLRKTPGDPKAGVEVFKLCAQCHKIHGEGQEVGGHHLERPQRFRTASSNVFDRAWSSAATPPHHRHHEKGPGRHGPGRGRHAATHRAEATGWQARNHPAQGRGRSGGEQNLADARGRGETAQASGDRRPVRLPLPGQTAERSEREADSGDAESGEVKLLNRKRTDVPAPVGASARLRFSNRPASGGWRYA